MRTVEVELRERLTVKMAALDEATVGLIREAWTYPNPLYDADKRLRDREVEDYQKAKEAGEVFKVRFAFRDAPPQTIQGYEDEGGVIAVPRGGGTRTLANLLREQGYEPVLLDRRCPGLAADIHLTSGWEPYLYQSEAVKALVASQRGYVLAPTAAGKTVIALCLAARLRVVTLIIAHTTEILDGWHDEIHGNERSKTHAKLAGQFVTSRIQGTKGALDAARKGDIILATMQTLSRCGRDVLDTLNERVGLCINDETHHAPADTFWNTLNEIAAKFRVGFTATDKRKDRLDFLLTEVIGPKVYEIDDRTLVRAGKVLLPHVELVPTNFYPRVKKRDRFGEEVDDIVASRQIAESSYNRIELLNMMIEDDARNTLICDRVEQDWKDGYVCAVLTERVAHLPLLEANLTAKGMVVAILKGSGTSKVAREQKRKIKEGVMQGQIDVVLGTSVLDEGVNIPLLSALHLTCPANNEGKIVQQVGRIRRAHGKQPPVVRDYIDYRCKAVIPSMHNRRKWYRKRKWPLKDIDLRTMTG